MIFGREKERRRQWSLLGQLLRGLKLLDALDFMDRAFGQSAVHWRLFREKSAMGCALSELVKEYEPKTPADVVEALQRGEADGRLPERLADLPLPEPMSRFTAAEEEAGVVGLVNQILVEAVENGIPRVGLTLLPNGEGAVGHPDGEGWRVVQSLPAAFIPNMKRRLWVLAGQPYWAPQAGTFRLRMPSGEIDARVFTESDGTLAVELRRNS